jgi:hypothetical protein
MASPLAGTHIGRQAVVENVFMRLGEFSDNWGVVLIDWLPMETRS